MDEISIGNYIYEKRREKGLTQEQLAEVAGVSSKTISTWETGKFQTIKFLNLQNLAAALCVTPWDIIAGRDLTELDMETKETLEKRFQEMFEKIDDVHNVTITIEDRNIFSTDIALGALVIALLAMGVGVWAAFPNSIIGIVGSIFFGIMGVFFIVFGRKIVRKMEKQLRERKKR
ncbi:MAG: helix-turn-helix transcriptional regulator [Parasporobacterium sp.]|nr:helix-turn-helix transcriptional regulator [Parasporobacterium sp.]